MRVSIRSGVLRGSLLIVLSHLPAQFASADTYGSGWYREFQLSVGHEENVSRSYKSADLTDDRTASVTLGAGYSQNLATSLRYIVSGYVSYTYHDEFDKLSSVATSLGTSLIYQPGAGFKSPWYTAKAEIAHLKHADSEARDGYFLSGTLAINRRFGLNSTGRLGYRYHDLAFFGKSAAKATRDAAFDVARHEIFVGADIHLTRRAFLILEYGYQHGGFTTSVSGSTVGLTYDAETEDSAFESCNRFRCTPYYAFRSVTGAQVADVGVAFPGGRLDYDLSLRFIRAKSDAGPTYDDWIGQAGLSWNF